MGLHCQPNKVCSLPCINPSSHALTSPDTASHQPAVQAAWFLKNDVDDQHRLVLLGQGDEGTPLHWGQHDPEQLFGPDTGWCEAPAPSTR